MKPTNADRYDPTGIIDANSSPQTASEEWQALFGPNLYWRLPEVTGFNPRSREGSDNPKSANQVTKK